MVIIIVSPIVFSLLLIAFKKKLHHAHIKARMGTLYEELKTNSNPALCYFIIFALRRLEFTCSSIFLTDYPII
jgi:hypothetical protein